MKRLEKKRHDHQRLMETIESCLRPDQLITTRMVWQVCRERHRASYDITATLFRIIMESLMEKRQAIRTGRGQYILTNMSLQEKKLIEHAPIREVIESSLFPGKEATTRMVYEQCRGLASYVVVRDVFHSVCGQLVTEGRAKKIVNGRYLILKNKF